LTCARTLIFGSSSFTVFSPFFLFDFLLPFLLYPFFFTFVLSLFFGFRQKNVLVVFVSWFLGEPLRLVCSRLHPIVESGVITVAMLTLVK
jgi:hypothetical protein